LFFGSGKNEDGAEVFEVFGLNAGEFGGDLEFVAGLLKIGCGRENNDFRRVGFGGNAFVESMIDGVGFEVEGVELRPIGEFVGGVGV